MTLLDVWSAVEVKCHFQFFVGAEQRRLWPIHCAVHQFCLNRELWWEAYFKGLGSRFYMLSKRNYFTFSNSHPWYRVFLPHGHHAITLHRRWSKAAGAACQGWLWLCGAPPRDMNWPVLSQPKGCTQGCLQLRKSRNRRASRQTAALLIYQQQCPPTFI